MPAPETDSNSRVAYRQPQPAEMALDLVVAHKTVPADNRNVSESQYQELLARLVAAHGCAARSS